MPKYILAYHGAPAFSSREEGMKHMGLWRSWMEGVGSAIVDRGAPFGKSSTVTSKSVTNDGGASPLSGYSVVEAKSVEDAIALAKPCPHLNHENCSIEIAELLDMDM